MSSRQHRSRAIIILDTQTFEVEQVYINYTRQRAMQHFLRLLLKNVDVAYDDMRGEAAKMIERYQFIETDHVIGR